MQLLNLILLLRAASLQRREYQRELPDARLQGPGAGFAVISCRCQI